MCYLNIYILPFKLLKIYCFNTAETKLQALKVMVLLFMRRKYYSYFDK